MKLLSNLNFELFFQHVQASCLTFAFEREERKIKESKNRKFRFYCINRRIPS